LIVYPTVPSLGTRAKFTEKMIKFTTSSRPAEGREFDKYTIRHILSEILEAKNGEKD